MKLSYLLLATLPLVACGGDSPPPTGPITASLTGTWNAPSAGALYNLQLQLTEQSQTSVTGQWSGYATSCTPLNAPACLRNGSVSSGSRNGSTITLELIPNSPCGTLNATITATFSTTNVASGTLVQHPCNGADLPAASLTLTRQ